MKPPTLADDAVRVVNLHEETWVGTGTYIGRPSMLGNPYPIGKETRTEVVERYRKEWLWPILEAGLAGKWPAPDATEFSLVADPKQGWTWAAEATKAAVWGAVLGLARRALAGERLVLLCYCKPLECHGDVLAKAIRWLAGQL